MVIPIFQILLVLLTFTTICSIAYAIYIKWKNTYTRERFAFAALFATSSLTIFGITTIFNIPPWTALIYIWSLFQDKPMMLFKMSFSDKLLVLIFIGYSIYIIHRYYSKWEGLTSVNQHQMDNIHEYPVLYIEGFKELIRIIRRKPPIKVYEHKNYTTYFSALSQPFHKLTWRDQARELIMLKFPEINFHSEEGWHESKLCWVGKNIKTNAIVGLLCIREEPSAKERQVFINYIEKCNSKFTDQSIELFIAIQDGNEQKNLNVDNYEIIQETESTLLNDLVNFKDYFIEIKKRVEFECLPDSDLTLKDVYVESMINLPEDDNAQQKLEKYLLSWVNEPGQRHLSLLGEYGQGKSTGTLIFTYNLIYNHANQTNRIPILIELRGKSPKSLEPLELLGAWGSLYRIEAQSLMKLLIDGRLIIIFEGFDEMADVSDVQARLSHFKSLWRFCYPKAKILISGRPNLFLDDRELKAALGIEKSFATGPYCESIELKPFNIAQINKTLRWAKDEVREQIVKMAKHNHHFFEIVSRPSLLYVVSRLWESPELIANLSNINSALITGLFIKHSYKRQTVKHRDHKEFMILSESEREYFMDGISAFMAANDLKNQIVKEHFSEAISNLYKEIPDNISNKESAIVIPSNSNTIPLKERLKSSEKPLDLIETDVRTYGILVRDYSRISALKFPHKSFYEYLFANYVGHCLTNTDKEIFNSIKTATNATPEKIINIPDSLPFLSELISLNKNISENLSIKSNKYKYMNELFELIVYRNKRFFSKFNNKYVLHQILRTKRMTQIAFSITLVLFISISLLFLSKYNNKERLEPFSFNSFNELFEKLNDIETPNILQQIESKPLSILICFFIFMLIIPMYYLMFILYISEFMRNTFKRRLVIWFIILIYKGINKNDFYNSYGKIITEGLTDLIEQYGHKDLLIKYKY